MAKTTRRHFMNSLVLMGGAVSVSHALGKPNSTLAENGAALKDMPIGIITPANNPEADLARVRALGFSTCQMDVDKYSPELAGRIRQALEKNALQPCALLCAGPGNYFWNFFEGPPSIGLVPRKYRAERVVRLKQGIDFCREAGIPAVHAHFGFIPEVPSDDLYKEFITAAKEVATYAKERNVLVYCETGQETPVTLLRAIEDIGTGNVFVNYDVANLILYGKANPLDGLEVIGKYVRALHAKDGFYPTNPRELGREVPIGKGKVDFPGIFRKLKELKFKGAVIIEYELGSQQADYLSKTKEYLEQLIKKA